MYAIRNKKTGKWLYETKHGRDYRRIQLTAYDRCKVFEDYEDAKYDFEIRHCSKDYEIVKVRLVVEE